MRKHDQINHPSHYILKSGIECKDVIEDMPYFQGAAIKYVWRCGLKSSDAIEDLRKAIKCIEIEIERRQKQCEKLTR